MHLTLLALSCAASLPLTALAHAGHRHDGSAEPIDVETLQQKWGTDVSLASPGGGEKNGADGQ